MLCPLISLGSNVQWQRQHSARSAISRSQNSPLITRFSTVYFYSHMTTYCHEMPILPPNHYRSLQYPLNQVCISNLAPTTLLSACAHAFTTFECADLSFILVHRSDAKKAAPYNRAILFYSLYEAFLDVSHKESTVDAVTATVESKLLDLRSTTVTGAQISQSVLSTLKPFSTPAFLRYLSRHAELSSARQLRKALQD